MSEDVSHIDNTATYDLVDQLGVMRLTDSLPHSERQSQAAAADVEAIQEIRKQVANTFRAFDTWTLRDKQTLEHALDVSECAEELEHLVLVIRRTCSGEEGLQWNVINHGVAALMDIIEAVLARNKDAHLIAHAAWGMVPSPLSTDRDSNLYSRMMRYGPDRAGSGIFEALNEIGHDILYQYSEQLKLSLQRANAVGISEVHRAEVLRLFKRLTDEEARLARMRSPDREDRGSSRRPRR